MNLIFGIKTIENDDFLNNIEFFLGLIPEKDRKAFLEFKNIKKIQLSLFGQILVRYVLSNCYKIDLSKLELKKNNHGKPYFECLPIFFNISHSGNWIIASFSEKEIGIDIERIRDPIYKVANRFFSNDELSLLEIEKNEIKKKELFFKIWTAKESYVKMLGRGISYSLNNFTVLINEEKCEINDSFQKKEIFLKYLSFDNEYIVACSSFEKSFKNNIETLNIRELIK